MTSNNSNNSNNSNKSNLNPFASLFEQDNDANDENNNNLDNFDPTPAPAPEAKPNALSKYNLDNDDIINNLEPIEAHPSEAQAPQAKPSTRAPLQCQLERNRGKPCPYHPLNFRTNFRTNGEPCPRAHKLTPQCPEERKGIICQGHFPNLGPDEQQCPFYHKPEVHTEVKSVSEVKAIPAPEVKTDLKCSNEVKYGFCGFHPDLFSCVNPPKGFACPRVHERSPPCPIQRSGAQCTVDNCGFFHKQSYNNNINNVLENQAARPTVASDLFAPRIRQQAGLMQVPSPIQVISINAGPPVARAKRHFDVPLPKICLTSINVVPV